MDQVAFRIFNFDIHWYGVLAALGFVLGFGTAGRRAPRAGIKSDTVFNLAPWLIVGTIIGARLLYVTSYWDQEFAGKPFWHVFNMRAGLVFYGGLIGASLAGIIFCLRNKVPLWRMGDVMAPSIALGHALGRIGCFMTGCCWGKPWDGFCAVRFPVGHETHGTSVHPVQLYESALNFAFYVGLAWLFRRRKFDGQVFAAYLVGYAIIRTITESFRGDYTKHYLGGILTPGQTVSILIFAAGIALWLKQRSARVPTLPAAA
ncbi:MAG TPA: prolipoprotein diacylglyceryl transferase [Verrucomicrobiae bacterium]